MGPGRPYDRLGAGPYLEERELGGWMATWTLGPKEIRRRGGVWAAGGSPGSRTLFNPKGFVGTRPEGARAEGPHAGRARNRGGPWDKERVPLEKSKAIQPWRISESGVK